MKQKLKTNNGITLIALIITIIIMLILVAVVVRTAIESNLFGKAKEAGDSWKNAEGDETNLDIDLADYSEYFEVNLPVAEGTTPYLPDDTFEYLTGTLEEGLVIKDEDENEYVWIEVPRTAIVYQTAGINITEFTAEEYTAIETDLHTYTNTYRESGYTDTYYADNTEGWFADSTAYDTAKNKMLKSVYENGGFWIGRYEAGIAIARTASGDATIAPVSKPNMYPYNFITRTQAKVLADNLSTTDYTASLMYGVQWDLVIKYLEIKGASQSELNSNSTNWGNYINNLYSITNTNAKYSTNNGSSYSNAPYNKKLSESVLLTTGASDTFSKQNIYDLAGNIREWTLEYTSNMVSSCATRGSNYDGNGSGNPVSIRINSTRSDSSVFVGFRVALYK